MEENGILAIAQLKQLHVLKLKRDKKVKADDFVSLFANKNLCKLQDLDLSECVQVNDEVIKTLAIECPHLEKVMLNWCWDIRDSGLCDIYFFLLKIAAPNYNAALKVTILPLNCFS